MKSRMTFLLGTGAAILLLLTGCQQGGVNSDDAAIIRQQLEDVASRLDVVEDRIDDMGNDANGSEMLVSQVRRELNQARNTLAEVDEKLAPDAVDDGLDDTTTPANDGLGDDLNDLGNDAGDTLNDLGNDAGDTLNDLGNDAGNALDGLGNDIENGVDDLRDRLNGADDGLQNDGLQNDGTDDGLGGGMNTTPTPAPNTPDDSGTVTTPAL